MVLAGIVRFRGGRGKDILRVLRCGISISILAPFPRNLTRPFLFSPLPPLPGGWKFCQTLAKQGYFCQTLAKCPRARHAAVGGTECRARLRKNRPFSPKNPDNPVNPVRKTISAPPASLRETFFASLAFFVAGSFQCPRSGFQCSSISHPLRPSRTFREAFSSAVPTSGPLPAGIWHAIPDKKENLSLLHFGWA